MFLVIEVLMTGSHFLPKMYDIIDSHKKHFRWNV